MCEISSKLGNSNLVSTFSLSHNILSGKFYREPDQIFFADVHKLSKLRLFLAGLTIR